MFVLVTFLMSIQFCFGQKYNVNSIEPELLENANAVVREESSEIELYDGKFIHHKYYAITLLDNSAESLLDVQIDYKEGSFKLVDFKAAIYNETGELMESINEKDLSDYSSYDGFSIITDHRLKHVKLSEHKYPFTISVTYDIESKNTFTLPFWIPLKYSNVSVEKTKISIINNSSSAIRVNENKLEEFNVEKKAELVYSCESIKAFSKEIHAPALMDMIPWVEFIPEKFVYENFNGSINDWASYGRFFYSNFLVKQNTMKPEEVKKEMAGVINTGGSKKEIVKNMYKYIQDNTRYISISLDEGGFKPMSTKDVHENKYGDCKALSFYMISLLKAYGIRSNYIEVYADADQRRSLNQNFASAYPGNHIIVNVPFENDTIWLDCTSSSNPFNYLGQFTDNRYALEISKDGGKLVKTPSYDDISYVREEAIIQLDVEGNIQMKLDVLNSGYCMDEVDHLNKYDDIKLSKYFKDRRFSFLKDLKLEAYSQTLNEDSLTIKESINLTAEDYVELAGSYYLVPIQFSKSSLPNIKSKKDRSFPIEFSRKISETKNYQFYIPDGFIFPDKVKSYNIESKYGKYTLDITHPSVDLLIVVSNLEIYSGTYEPSEIKELKTFLMKVKKHQNVQLILKSS